MNTKYKHLSCEERTLIQLSLERGCSIRAIARSLDRSATELRQLGPFFLIFRFESALRSMG